MKMIATALIRKSYPLFAAKSSFYHASQVCRNLLVESVPALGESITEGTIAKWAKNIGDKVQVDDVIVVIETDKVTVDVKASHAGIFTKKLASDIVSSLLTLSILSLIT
jgi:hypothetical protein